MCEGQEELQNPSISISSLLPSTKQMAISKSIAKTITSQLRRTIFPSNYVSKAFCSTRPESPSEFDDLPLPNPDPEPTTESPTTESNFTQERLNNEMPQTLLEGGLDAGIYKAVIVGQVGQKPFQKRLRNGRLLTMTMVGTGGIRNERIPFASEEPGEYANRCNVQWHRVTIYPDRMGEMVVKHAQPGSIIYLEGNLETKIFNDPITGLVRRIREIAVRRNGRVLFLGNGSDFSQPSPNELRGVGYF